MTPDRREEADVVYRVSPRLGTDEVNGLFAVAWEEHAWRDFDTILRHSLIYVCAYRGQSLVGFVNVAWDGGVHGFILDTTVHPDLRRRGIGRRLVRKAASAAADRGIEWLHVDFEPQLLGFYEACGFRHTQAGLMRLVPEEVL